MLNCSRQTHTFSTHTDVLQIGRMNKSLCQVSVTFSHVRLSLSRPSMLADDLKLSSDEDDKDEVGRLLRLFKESA